MITSSTKAPTDKSVVLELTWPKPSNKGNYQIITSASLFNSAVFHIQPKTSGVSKKTSFKK